VLPTLPGHGRSVEEIDVDKRTCLGCDAEIIPGPRERNKRLWCTASCRAKAKRLEGKTSEYAPRCTVRILECRYCTSLFVARTSKAKDVCRTADCQRIENNRQAREYAARYRQKYGKELRIQYPNHRTTPVSRKVRLGVYERDGWICQLCGEPVDPNLHPNHRYGATLDHIVCQSWTNEPDHSPANLRLSHRTCNSRRRNSA